MVYSSNMHIDLSLPLSWIMFSHTCAADPVLLKQAPAGLFLPHVQTIFPVTIRMWILIVVIYGDCCGTLMLNFKLKHFL